MRLKIKVALTNLSVFSRNRAKANPQFMAFSASKAAEAP